MYDTDHKTIKELFYKQISNLTKKTNNLRSSSFDYQFSDRWVNECQKPTALDW